MDTSNVAPNPSPLAIWQDAERRLRGGRFSEAGAGYQALLGDPAWRLPAQLRLSAVATEQGRVRDSVAHALAAHESGTDDPVMLAAICRRLIEVGELQAAHGCATSPVIGDAQDPKVLADVGALMSGQSFPVLAGTLLARARDLGLGTPATQHLLGLSQLYSGNLDAAGNALQSCLQAAPGYAPAWRDLARLRRATAEHNHVARLRELIGRTRPGERGAPLLHYALFRQLDDLGDTAGAWTALADGMHLRRGQLAYAADAERALFEYLRSPASEGRAAAGSRSDGPQPIFIVGMPRSGTTLLERILGAHPQVGDAGELRDFTWQMRWVCDLAGGSHLDLDLARAAADVDWGQLGERYLSHTRWHAGGHRFYTDKLPANFVHVGHIARALPQARIVHMRRDPMDVCFSNLKELFADAYPHSYDQREMAGHYLRYRALMAHWHARYPGRILDVDYAALVADPETIARKVLAFCDLPWEPGMIAVESRRDAVATASATQVREPIHQRFVGQWRRYAQYLQPLRDCLESGGVRIADPPGS